MAAASIADAANQSRTSQEELSGVTEQASAATRQMKVPVQLFHPLQ